MGVVVLGVEVMGVDILGVEVMGVDILGVDVMASIPVPILKIFMVQILRQLSEYGDIDNSFSVTDISHNIQKAYFQKNIQLFLIPTF